MTPRRRSWRARLETTAETIRDRPQRQLRDGIPPAELHKYEPTIPICSKAGNNACLNAATGAATEYTVTATAADTADEFTITEHRRSR